MTNPLNRLFLDWQNTTPGSGIMLKFYNATEVGDFYGTGGGTDPNSFYSMAKTFFKYNTPGAVFTTTRTALGQRPHLIPRDVQVTLEQLQSIHGPFSLTFNGHVYDGHVTMAGVTSWAQVAVRLQWAINQTLPVEATTSNSVIESQVQPFQGYAKGSQIYVTDGTLLKVGGHIYGPGLGHPNLDGSQLINYHPGDKNLPIGVTGHYSVFSAAWDTPVEAMEDCYSILHAGPGTGMIETGDQVLGPGIPLKTAVIEDLGGGDWLLNNSIDYTGPLSFTSTPMTVSDNEFVGVTHNRVSLEIQPDGAFGYDDAPSTLSYMTGPVADALGLSEATGAIDSWQGGLHQSMGSFLNGLASHDDFGSFQGIQAARFGSLWSDWSVTHGGDPAFINLTNTTYPAGQNQQHPVGLTRGYLTCAPSY